MARERIPVGSYGSISTREIKKGTWQAQAKYRYPDGSLRPVRKTASTKARAVAALTAKLQTLSEATGPVKPTTSIDVLARTWVAKVEASTRKASTKEKYSYIAREVVAKHLGALVVREVTPQVVVDFLNGLDTNRRSARAVLSQIMEEAVLSGTLTTNPVKAAAVAVGAAVRTSERRAVPKALDAEHLAALRYALTAWENEIDMFGHRKRRTLPLRHILMTQLAVGGRINEVLGLRWVDLDLDNGVVYITGALEPTNGPRVRGTTKSIASERGVRVPPLVTDMLTARLRAALARNPDLAYDSPVFASRTGTWLSHHNVERGWREARALAPEGTDLSWVTPHTLRKTAGTTVADALGVLAGVKLLGHAETRTFETFYHDRHTGVADVAEHTRGLVEGF